MILRAERSITADTAVRLGRYLGTGAAFWMNLQSQFDISLVEAPKGDAIDRELAGPIGGLIGISMVRHPKQIKAVCSGGVWACVMVPNPCG